MKTTASVALCVRPVSIVNTATPSNEAAIAEVKLSVAAVKASNEAAIAGVKASNEAAIADVKAGNEAAIAAVKVSNEASIAGVEASVARVEASNNAAIAEVRHDITRMGLRIVMWMFVLLTAHSALLLAAIKGMR